jgi:hypothetical protein
MYVPGVSGAGACGCCAANSIIINDLKALRDVEDVYVSLSAHGVDLFMHGIRTSRVFN